ncbi:MAG: aminopeptidase [Firmicutes bacterium]|nr:aminopeptidase [Bacillota bacterium]
MAELAEKAGSALKSILDVVSGEKLLIFCDEEKKDVAEVFIKGGIKAGLWTRTIMMQGGKENRKEVKPEILEALIGSKPDVCLNFLRSNIKETPFRISLIKLETRLKCRLGHCPGVNMEMLENGALSLSEKEQQEMKDYARRLIRKMHGAAKITVKDSKGTNLIFSVAGRDFFTDSIFDWKSNKWMNLPTGEITVGPVEDSLEGRLVCDGGIGGIGPIDSPLILDVEKGKVRKIQCRNLKIKKLVEDALGKDEWASVVGEFAVGINKKAKIPQEFLEMEKKLGTVHFAFGHNLDFPGGKNPSTNHLDFLISKPDVTVFREDKRSESFIKDGRIM